MTCSRLRGLLACSIIAGGVTTASASAAPPTITVDKTFGKVAGWSIAYSESLGGCLAAATYHDGTTIWFGYGGSGHSAFLAFTNSRWRSIEFGESYSIGMRARGAGDWHGNFVGFERNGDKGVFTSSLKDTFVSDLADAGSLAVSFNGRQVAALSLVGSLDALEAVRSCEKQSVVAQARSDGSSAAPGEDSAKDRSSQGTGFFVSDQGHVLTNNHVIDGCTEINVARGSGSPDRRPPGGPGCRQRPGGAEHQHHARCGTAALAASKGGPVRIRLRVSVERSAGHHRKLHGRQCHCDGRSRR